MNEARDVTTVARDFANETGADVRRVERWDHEHRLQLCRQVAIHERHLILILEIAHGAQSANQEIRAFARREVDKESAERLDLDARLSGQRGADQLDALVRRKQRLLRRICRDGDDQSIDELETSQNEVFVPARDGIEAAGVDGGANGHRGEGEKTKRRRRTGVRFNLTRPRSRLNPVKRDHGISVFAPVTVTRQSLAGAMLDAEDVGERNVEPTLGEFDT